MFRAVTCIGGRYGASLIFVSPPVSAGSAYQPKRTVYSKFAVPDYAKDKVAPWPYKERGYRYWHQFADFGVTKRFDENSKIIIVEGNTGSGKSKFAKDLAERLGFYHIPDPPFDDLFIDSYGDDRRLYYHLYPETCRAFDTRMFYEQPRHRNVAQFQTRRFMCRVEAYLNALAHLLNTGQGVVLERHYGSDVAYMEAMYNKGYLSDPYRHYYHTFLCRHLRNDIELHPHLVVFLDCPVSRCLENIKKYHKPWEWQNEVMDYKYLEDIDKGLKGWVKEISRHAEVVTYDWTDGGDFNAVAEDIERLDLDTVDVNKNEKFETWYLVPHEMSLTETRYKVTSTKWEYLQIFFAKPFQVEEMIKPIGDLTVEVDVKNLIYGKYAPGFRKDRGDSPADMMKSTFRDQVNNKLWNEYYIKDSHLVDEYDVVLYIHGFPTWATPSFPEEFLQPRSPYKSDGGCMAHAELFMDESGHLIHPAQ